MSKALLDSSTFGLFTRHAITHPLDFAASVGPTLNEATFGLLGSSFDPQRDIGDLSGKVILVTGGMRPRSLLFYFIYLFFYLLIDFLFLIFLSLDVVIAGC